MTDVLARPTSDPAVIDLRDDADDATAPASGPDRPEPAVRARRPEPAPLTRRRTALLAATWLVVTVIGVLLVLYQVGPLVQQREQRSLMKEFRTDLVAAANAAYGLPGASAPTRAPETGTPVALLDGADLALRHVVAAGVGADQPRKGPGHVPGTAGPGQPGNSVVVGRRSLAGGPFGSIGDLAVGDQIVVTTTQGRSVYVVGHVGTHRLVEGSAAGSADADTVDQYAEADDASGEAAPEDEADEPLLADGPVTVDELQGPSDDDRLTLVTSASGNPFTDDEAVVVVAEMDGIPFTPTPQGGRTASADGRHAGDGATAPLVLALLVYAAVVVGAVIGYRRLPWRGAYLITAPPLVAATMLLAEQLLRTFPAWA